MRAGAIKIKILNKNIKNSEPCMIIQASLYLSKPIVSADCWYVIILCFMCDHVTGAMVYWFPLLHNFIQLSLNSGSAQVQTLLAACQRSAMVMTSDNGHGWKQAFRRSAITQKLFIIIIHII